MALKQVEDHYNSLSQAEREAYKRKYYPKTSSAIKTHSEWLRLLEQYCDVIINRWQNFTGKKAVHENGTEFVNGD